MSMAPPTSLPGTGRLAERQLTDAAFDPCFDLIADGEILACLFYDDKPECAYATVDVENEDGEIERVPGALAGLDEDEVGWCLQFTDEPRVVDTIARVPAAWHAQARGTAWILLAARVRERGLWEAAEGFRLWHDAPDAPG